MRGIFLKRAMESEVQVEKELCIWALLKDTHVLSQAETAEKQEQVSILFEKDETNFVGGVIRIRKSTDKDGQSKCVLCIKQDHRERGDAKTEVETEVDESFFIQLAGLAKEMVVKHRYEFPVEGTEYVWEVDAAPDGKGGYYPWVRMELEMSDLGAPLPEFPFPTEDVLLPAGRGETTEEEYAKKSKELFEAYYVRKGPLTGYVQDAASTVLVEGSVADTTQTDE